MAKKEKRDNKIIKRGKAIKERNKEKWLDGGRKKEMRRGVKEMRKRRK